MWNYRRLIKISWVQRLTNGKQSNGRHHESQRPRTVMARKEDTQAYQASMWTLTSSKKLFEKWNQT